MTEPSRPHRQTAGSLFGSDNLFIVGIARRRQSASELLAGYVTGPEAATQATAAALARTEGARAIVLVEGISDQIALETLAVRRGRDLAAEGVTILPVGGAHGLTRYLRRFGPEGAGLRLAGLCDAGEEEVLRRGLAAAAVGSAASRADLERMRFHVCVEDLEDELIRAAGAELVRELFAAHGDLDSFGSMRRQPAWRGRAEDAQMRRFLGAGSARKIRYARLLVDAVDLSRVPRPLDAVLADV